MHLARHVAKQQSVNADQSSLPLPTSESSVEISKKSTSSGQKDDEDAWAVQYVNIRYLQAIAEAIDDDGSGFINIDEVNAFTMMRPEGWS
ncbi:hypothetical protein C0993_005724, partial [Termitomyces sp. T159_Od127]